MKLCDHVDFNQETKTYTVDAVILAEGVGNFKCSECKTDLDLSPLRDGGYTIKGDWSKSE